MYKSSGELGSHEPLLLPWQSITRPSLMWLFWDNQRYCEFKSTARPCQEVRVHTLPSASLWLYILYAPSFICQVLFEAKLQQAPLPLVSFHVSYPSVRYIRLKDVFIQGPNPAQSLRNIPHCLLDNAWCSRPCVVWFQITHCLHWPVVLKAWLWTYGFVVGAAFVILSAGLCGSHSSPPLGIITIFISQENEPELGDINKPIQGSRAELVFKLRWLSF